MTEASDDVLREQFDERYYGDSEKVRWERFTMDSSAPLDDNTEEVLAEAVAPRHSAGQSSSAATGRALWVCLSPLLSQLSCSCRHQRLIFSASCGNHLGCAHQGE